MTERKDRRGYKLAEHLPGHRHWLEEHAAKPGGVSAPEAGKALEITTDRAGTQLWQLVRRGRLFSASVWGWPKRYFSTLDAAEAWRESTPPRTPEKKQRKPTPPKKGKAVFNLSKQSAVAAPVTIKPSKAGPVIYPPGLKITRCPSQPAFGPAGRIYVDPKTKIVGGFQSLGPGRYMEDRCDELKGT